MLSGYFRQSCVVGFFGAQLNSDDLPNLRFLTSRFCLVICLAASFGYLFDYLLLGHYGEAKECSCG